MSEAGLLLSEPGSDVGDLPLVPEPRRQGRRGDDGGSDQEDAYRDRPQGGEQKFRFCSRSAFLTYPRCPILPRNYLRHIGFDREQIKTAFGKQEKHLDGTLHLHIWITFIRKVDTVNPRYFDATIGNDEEMQRVTYHCNIRREDRRRSGVSNAIRAYEYLCKYDGTVPVDIVGSTRLYPTSRNFRKEYGDRSQWLAYLAVSAMPAPTYPIRLPDGDEADTPLASCKQRHLWIWGPASSGKTLWLEKNIVCFRNYRVAGTMYPFDNYDGEQIIVYDDVIPKAEHLLSICNSSAYPRPCPGQTRYHVRYVPGNLVTLVIVCNNHCIDNLFNGESDATRAAIHTRFREILCNLEDV